VNCLETGVFDKQLDLQDTALGCSSPCHDCREDVPKRLSSLARLLMGYSPVAVDTHRVINPKLPKMVRSSNNALFKARAAPSMQLFGPQRTSRRFFAGAAAAAIVAPMLPASARGPSSLSGKPRPETGVILLDPPQANGQLISAEIVCDNGIVASLAWESDLKLAIGTYYDLEANNQAQDAVYVQVAKLPQDASLEAVPKDFFRKAIFGDKGRFSSYGAPSEVSIKDKGMRGATRLLDVKFGVLSSGQTDLVRRGVIAAVQPSGSTDAVMLFGSTADTRWQDQQPSVRRAVESFQVTKTRTSKLARVFEADYRYAGGGIEDDATGKRVGNSLAQKRALASEAGSLAGSKFAQ